MSEFTQNIASSFPNQNILFNSASGITGQQIQQNQLGIQQKQLELTDADHEQVARLSAALLNEPDVAKRADLYARGVGMLQSQGLAKYAPPTLPDESTLRSLVNQSVPVADQYKMGIISPPGLTEALARASAPPPGYGATGATATPATTPPGSGATIGQRQNNPGNLTFAGQPGAQPGQGNRFASFPDMPSGVAATADQLALYQTQHNINTVRGAVTRWVSDPKADLTSYIGDISKALGVGPDDKIDLTNPDVQAKFIQAQFPHESAGGGYVLNPADVAKGVQMAAANRGRAVQAPGTAFATAAPATAQPGQPVPTQVASNTPMVSTAPPATTAATAQPGQPQPAPAPAATAQPGATPLPGTGVNSQQFQTALWKTQQAALLETQFPNSPAAKAKAAELRAEAALYMQADSVITLPNGIQVKALSGQQVDAAKPLPHYVYDAAQHAYIDTTGTNKPEFEPAQRDSAVAQRDVMELGPKVANGTATQAEQARYATAVETYRQPVLRENPVSKETVRVNTRELPAGFPEPPSLGGGGASGGAGAAGGANVVMPGLSPAQQQVERDPAAYKVSESQYDRDSKEIPAIGDAGRQSQADQIRIQEMRDVLQRFNTGSGTEARTAASAFLQRWLPASLTGWEKESANLSGSDAAQAFSKLALTGAGSQERGVLGGRGGYQAIRLFKDANPNVNLQDATNRSILNMQLIGNQANQDYAQAALSHFADNEKKFGETHQYDSLAQFDRQWNAQKNPQVYAAAMGAIGGQDSSQWAKNLSADEVQRVKDIVARADPSAVIDMPGVGRVGTGVSSSTTQPTRIIHYDHTGKRISE